MVVGYAIAGLIAAIATALILSLTGPTPWPQVLLQCVLSGNCAVLLLATVNILGSRAVARRG